MTTKIVEFAEHCDFYVGNEHSDKSFEEKERLWLQKYTEMVLEECIDNLFWHGYDDAARQLEWVQVNRFGVKNEDN